MTHMTARAYAADGLILAFGALSVWALWCTRDGLSRFDRATHYGFNVVAWSWLISTAVFGANWPMWIDTAAWGVCAALLLLTLTRTQLWLRRTRREIDRLAAEFPTRHPPE